MNRITFSPAPATAVRIGRLVDNNLTNWCKGTMNELARADRAGDDTSSLLTVGLAILRARHAVRAGIRDAELQRHGGRRR